MPGRWLTVAARRQTICREWTESNPRRWHRRLRSLSTRRPRVGGRVFVRLLMWSLPFLAAAGGAVLLAGRRPLHRDRQRLRQGRPGLYRHRIERPDRRGRRSRENQRVSRGQLLYRLDDTPYRLALAKIESDIEIQRAEIRGLRAQWRTKREDIKAALSQQVYAQADYERQKDLAERKFAPAAKLEESRMSADVARQRIASAEEDLQRIEAQLAGDPKIRVDDHPRVKQMLAARDEALLNLRRTTIEAPLDGIVSKVLVPGSYAVMGVPSVAVVADTDLWIEANFKETELTRVRVGQPVTIPVDTYPDMKCTGKVTSLAQSTGAEFAVLPPQNATGNWVKVVQRIPVAHLGPMPRGRSAAAGRHERDDRDRHRPQAHVRRHPQGVGL